MKKKFLAVNVALALGAMSGLAAATVTIPVPDVAVGALGTAGNVGATQGNVVVSENHIGTINVVPYYSVQNGNETLLTITNNDRVNGKVVKVRFRGAQWSDDVLDFQVFLSPFDVWTANIVKDVSGVAKILKPEDKTATLPLVFESATASDGALFVADVRLAKDNPDGTLEGYIEIITVADIPPVINGADAGSVNDRDASTPIANPLYVITKHEAGGAPRVRTEQAAADALVGLAEDNYWTYGYTTGVEDSNNAGQGLESGGKAGRTVVTGPANKGLHLYNNNHPIYWGDDDLADPAAASNSNGAAQPAGASYTIAGTSYSQFGKDKQKLSDDWLQFPTTGISTFVTVINVDKLRSYTLQATALKNSVAVLQTGLNRSLATSGVNDTNGVGAIKAYFQQRGTTADGVAWEGKGERATADRIFGLNPTTGVGYVKGDSVAAGLGGFGGVQLLQWDLPDLSTPTTAEVANLGFPGGTVTTTGLVVTNPGITGATAAAAYAASVYPGGPAGAQRDLVAAALQAPGFAFDYVTEPIINGSTDIVVNQPVRRFFYWYDQLADDAKNFHREFVSPDGKFNIYGEINTPYEVLSGAPLETAEGTKFGGYISLDSSFFTGREEEVSAGNPGGVGFSPAPPAAATSVGLFGEVSVISVNTTSGPSGALLAELTNNRTPKVYNNGWGYINTTVKGNALTAAKFIPSTTTPVDSVFGLAGHSLLVGSPAPGASENVLPTAVHHGTGYTGHSHSLQLPFIGYITVNVDSPAIGRAYGTTLPVRKGPQLN
jgi:hypothetical protein